VGLFGFSGKTGETTGPGPVVVPAPLLLVVISLGPDGRLMLPGDPVVSMHRPVNLMSGRFRPVDAVVVVGVMLRLRTDCYGQIVTG
jgi:hypothetical protein